MTTTQRVLVKQRGKYDWSGVYRFEPCGHEVEYAIVKPGKSCPECRREEAQTMGEARSELIRRGFQLMKRRQRAQTAHEYGRLHDRAICPLCAVGATFWPRPQNGTKEKSR